MTLRKVKVEGGLFQIAMTKQHLDGAQVRTRFEQMSCKTVAKRVRVNLFLEARTSSGLLASEPNHFGIDRVRGRMPTIAGEEPSLGLQSAPVLAQGFQ